MSPLKVCMLLHYYSRTDDYVTRFIECERPHAKSDAVSAALQHFVDDGLLASQFSDIHWATGQDPRNFDKPIFSITDKGRAMVDAICAVQVPICKWVQP